MASSRPTSNTKPASGTAVKRPAAKRPTTPARQAAAAASQPKSATKPPATAAAAAPKQKLVRDSFTIPKAEFEVLSALKQRAAALARPTKKSELLRAGIAELNRLQDKAFVTALNSVPSLKTGRPKRATAAAKAKVAKKT